MIKGVPKRSRNKFHSAKPWFLKRYIHKSARISPLRHGRPVLPSLLMYKTCAGWNSASGRGGPLTPASAGLPASSNTQAVGETGTKPSMPLPPSSQSTTTPA